MCNVFFFGSLFQNCRYSKLEKADILEMTVRFLTDIQSTPSKGQFSSDWLSFPFRLI